MQKSAGRSGCVLVWEGVVSRCQGPHTILHTSAQNIFEDNAAMSADEARRLIESMKVRGHTP